MRTLTYGGIPIIEFSSRYLPRVRCNPKFCCGHDPMENVAYLLDPKKIKSKPLAFLKSARGTTGGR